MANEKDFPFLKQALHILVDESKPLNKRLEKIFEDSTQPWSKSWFKPAIFSPILHVIAPDKYAIFNKGVAEILKSKYSEQFNQNDWKTYERANRKLNYMAVERNCSLYELDQQLGGQSSKSDSSYFKKLKEASGFQNPPLFNDITR